MTKEPCPIAQFDWRACAGRFLLSHGFVMQSPPMPIGQVQDYLESFGREMLSAIVQEKEHFKQLAQDAINLMPNATYKPELGLGESREPLPCEHTFVKNYGNTRRACSKCGRFEELGENGFELPSVPAEIEPPLITRLESALGPYRHDLVISRKEAIDLVREVTRTQEKP